MNFAKYSWTKNIEERYDSQTLTGKFMLLWNDHYMSDSQKTHVTLYQKIIEFVDTWKDFPADSSSKREILSNFLQVLHEQEKIDIDLIAFLIKFDN